MSRKRAGFDGATLLAAQKAFYEELVDFFRSRGRADMDSIGNTPEGGPTHPPHRYRLVLTVRIPCSQGFMVY